MPVQDFQCSITISAPAQEIFDKLSRVSEWWAKDFQGSARKPGDAFTVRSGKTFMDFRVVEIVPDTRIVWQVTDCNLSWIDNKTEWKGTSVIWEISSRNGSTTLKMTHRGLVPGIECYASCEQGWNYYVMKSLLQFLAEGKGLPDSFRRY